MKVIFLDVDGVLNTGRYRKLLKKREGISYYDAQFIFDVIAMRNLKDLVSKYNAKIVISSTWRYFRHNEDNMYWKVLMGTLKAYQLDDKVIGVTPDLRDRYNTICCRGHEIKSWLDECNIQVDNYVILDDDANLFHEEDNHLVLTDDFYGFDKNSFELENKILSNGFKTTTTVERALKPGEIDWSQL